MVLDAIKVGYRHIDTAAYYQNEESVGRAIKDCGLERDDIFVTTKIWYDSHGYDKALAACDRSLSLLKMDHVDLLLIHWPKGEDRLGTWKAFEKILSDGKARAIGVSNYMIRHLEEIVSTSGTVPAVDQVEFSPFLYQKDLLEYCQDHGIAMEAYSPLTRGSMLGDNRIAKLASKYEKTPAQMMIRWVIQKGMIVIPKTTHIERMKENANVFDFEISDADMRSMDALDEGLHTTWDPNDIP